MKRKNLIIIVIILGLIIAGGVFGMLMIQNGKISPIKLKLGPNINTEDVVDANNQFAIDYYFQLKDKEKGNIFFSPFSISSAIAMTYEGAKGQTAQEIQNVFHFSDDIASVREQYAKLYADINKMDKKYELNTANALWAQKDYKFLNEYFDVIKKYYGGEVKNLDFANSKQSSKTINSWVAKNTKDKIQKIIDSTNSDMKLILTNAIYFKGDWEKQFDENLTHEENFIINNDNITKAQMMRNTKEEFYYGENNDLQILNLPYSDNELSMIILLPKNNDLKNVENLLDLKNLNDWTKNLKEQKVYVYIPTFKFETQYLMAYDLKEMGMPLAFALPSADFSGMTGKRDLKISDVIHKAFIDTNEKGTEAAAVTAIVVGITSVGPGEEKPIPVFRADHPFIFLIQENKTGNILFIGRIMNPNS